MDDHNYSQPSDDVPGEHIRALSEICRLCHAFLKKNAKGYSVETYETEIERVYHLDLAFEKRQSETFPRKICDTCYFRMHKARQNFENGKDYKPSMTKAAVFKPHHCWAKECPVCSAAPSPVAPGRPAKRKRLQNCPSNNSIKSPAQKKSTITATNNKENVPPPEDQQSAFNSVLNQLKNCSLSNEQLCQLAFALGNSQSGKISLDFRTFDQSYRQLEVLINADMAEWIANRNGVVVNFLSGIIGSTSFSALSGKRQVAFVKEVESVYHMSDLKCISPFSFSESLLGYAVSSSKLVVNVFGASTPAPQYSTIRDWLANQATSPPEFPSGDVVVAFDNDQVVGKTYTIKVNSKAPTNVVTSVIGIQIDAGGQLQHDCHFKPQNWFRYEGFKEEIAELRKTVTDTSGYMYLPSHLEETSHKTELFSTHCEEMHRFLEQRLNKVVSEQVCNDNGQISDIIDKKVEEKNLMANSKRCAKCGKLVSKTKRKCDNDQCKANLKQAEIDSGQTTFGTFTQKEHTRNQKVQEVRVEFKQVVENNQTVIKPVYTCSSLNSEEKPYDHVPSGHPKIPPAVTMCDPVFVNPCSYEAVKVVLRQIGKSADISSYGTGNREWLVLYMDGTPYILAQKLIRETFICQECGACIDGEDKLESHYRSMHAALPIKQCLEFDWVLLRPGAGHYEMNMIKSFVELNWEVFFSSLAYEVGFRSELAQKYAKSCGDNHKAFELLNIFRAGTVDELLVPYVRSAMELKENPTIDGLLRFIAKSENANYQYAAEQCLTYAQAIFNYRAGVRRNNQKFMASGKLHFTPIFFARNHPKYQLIAVTDEADRALFPQQINLFLDKSDAVSPSGNPSAGQGPDFILEEKNKKSKAWIHGVPDSNQWLQTFRNLDKLDILRSCTMSRLCLNDAKCSAQSWREGGSSEIETWRIALRRVNYFSNPLNSKHVSVRGTALDQELVKLTALSLLKRNRFISKYLLKQDVPDEINNLPAEFPVFVTPEEHHKYTDIKGRTKLQIEQQIMLKMQELPSELQGGYLAFWQAEKKGNKEKYIVFYEELCATIDAMGIDTSCND